MTPFLIKYKSPLRRIPIQINPREAFILDGIRISMEMISANASTLTTSITDFSILDPFATPKIGTSLLFSSAWAIIDNSARLNRLLKALATKVVDADLQTMLDEIHTVRNTFQHIDERIEEFFVDNGGALLGYLTWFFIIDDKNINMFMVKSGIDNKGTSTSIVFNDISNGRTGIHHLVLTSFKRVGKGFVESNINITLLIDMLEKLLISLEGLMEKTIKANIDNPDWDNNVFTLGEVKQLQGTWKPDNTATFSRTVLHDEFRIIHHDGI